MQPLIIFLVADENGLGLRAQWDAPVDDHALLWHAVSGWQGAGYRVALGVARDIEARVATALEGLNCAVHALHVNTTPWKVAAQARAFGYTGWAGGLAETFYMDEAFDAQAILGLCRAEGADRCLVGNPASPWVIPSYAQRLLEALDSPKNPQGFAFTTSPAGLTPWAITADTAMSFLQKGDRPGSRLAYFPGTDVLNLAIPGHTVNVEAAVAGCALRFSAESTQGLDFVRELYAQLPACHRHDPLALTAKGQDMMAQPAVTGSVPQHITLELSNRSTITNALYPEGQTERPEMDFDGGMLDVLEGLCQQRNDMVFTLGGYGDPLLHPDLLRIIQRLKAAGAYGIHVATNGVGLTGTLSESLLNAPVDVISIRLDGVDDASYARFKTGATYSDVHRNLIDFLSLREAQEGNARGPLLVPTCVKTQETIDTKPVEIETFFEYWHAKVGHGPILAPNHYSGQWPDRNVLPLLPSFRRPCRQLRQGMWVLCDGRISLCAQDFKGLHTLGQINDLGPGGVAELWTGQGIACHRHAHAQERFDSFPLCAQCRDWM